MAAAADLCLSEFSAGKIKFDEVAVYLSEEEWDYLNVEQKELYKSVMMENYQNLTSLGLTQEKPSVISKIESGEKPHVSGLQKITEKKVKTSNNGSTRQNTSGQHYNTVTKKCRTRTTTKLHQTISVQYNINGFKPQRRRQRTTRKRKNECSECGKYCASMSALLIHQRIHTGEKPYACPECWKCFVTKSSLLRHQQVHTGQKIFACSECEKKFTQKSNLIRHKNLHRGEKLFACSECEKRFARKSHLIRHKNLHTGEKPFACSECEKKFSRKSQLISHVKMYHERIYTGERPFMCLECGKDFNNNSHLVLHQQIHINILMSDTNVLTLKVQ
ncbi:zinc finger protein 250-like [Discoglossus pictus]